MDLSRAIGLLNESCTVRPQCKAFASNESVPKPGFMAKPTQAHMTRTVEANQPRALFERTKTQMEYYMGAKLIEVGVDPKSAIYRWSVEAKGRNEVWTYSAYWDDSKEKKLVEESRDSAGAE